MFWNDAGVVCITSYLEFGAVMTADILLSASEATAWNRAGLCWAAAPRPYKADWRMLASGLWQPFNNNGRI